MELDGSDHPVRRGLEGDIEGHLVHPMRSSLVLGEGGQRIGVGDGDDQVVGVEGLDPRRILEGRTPIGWRPADIGHGHGLALVEEVEEPAVEPHLTLEPPVLGEAVEVDGPRTSSVGRRQGRSAWRHFRGCVLLAPEAKRHGPLFLRSSAVLADGIDNGRIRKGRRVAEGPAFGDVTEEPAHDLARASLGQIRDEHEVLRLGRSGR